MNILPLLPSFNLLEPQRNCVKLNSPSYTNTTQTQASSISKTPRQCSFHNQTLPHQKHTNQPHKHHNSTQTPQMTQKSENNPYLVVDSIKWDNNIGSFTSEMQIKVQYTVTKQLQENITWKVTYLGSAYTDLYDQTLIEFQTQENDPTSSYPQKRQFKLIVQPPKWNLISPQQLFNISAIAISAHYKSQQFLKVGFYVHYQLPALTKEEICMLSKLEKSKTPEEKQDKIKNLHKTKKITKNHPKTIFSKHHCLIDSAEQKVLLNILQRTVRTILAQKPRVTKFQINWQKKNIAQEVCMKQNVIQSEPSINLQSQHLITEYTRVLKSESLFSYFL